MKKHKKIELSSSFDINKISNNDYTFISTNLINITKALDTLKIKSKKIKIINNEDEYILYVYMKNPLTLNKIKFSILSKLDRYAIHIPEMILSKKDKTLKLNTKYFLIKLDK
jgi:hypothetical protein